MGKRGGWAGEWGGGQGSENLQKGEEQQLTGWRLAVVCRLLLLPSQYRLRGFSDGLL